MKLEFSHQLPVTPPMMAASTTDPLLDSNCCLSHHLRKAPGYSWGRGASEYPHSHHTWLAPLWLLVKVVSCHSQHGGNCGACAGCWVIINIAITCRKVCGIEQNRGSCLPSQRLIWCLRDKFGNLVDETWTIKREALGGNARRGVWGWGCWFSWLWETVIRGVTAGRSPSRGWWVQRAFAWGRQEIGEAWQDGLKYEGWRRVIRVGGGPEGCCAQRHVSA